MENLKNKLLTIYMRGLEPFDGILINFSENWLLIANNSVDFVIDGYLLVNKNRLQKVEKNPKNEFAEKVILLKTINLDFNISINLFDVEPLLFFKNNDIMVSITLHDDSVCYVGRIKNINNKLITLKSINIKGEWTNDKKIVIDRIRYISFYDDYTLSLNNFINISATKNI